MYFLILSVIYTVISKSPSVYVAVNFHYVHYRNKVKGHLNYDAGLLGFVDKIAAFGKNIRGSIRHCFPTDEIWGSSICMSIILYPQDVVSVCDGGER
jgi:hypothetical protein